MSAQQYLGSQLEKSSIAGGDSIARDWNFLGPPSLTCLEVDTGCPLGPQPEHRSVPSHCGLGCPTEWPAQTSNSKCSDHQSECFITFFNLALKIMQPSITYKQVTSPPGFKETRYKLSLSVGSVSRNSQSFFKLPHYSTSSLKGSILRESAGEPISS